MRLAPTLGTGVSSLPPEGAAPPKGGQSAELALTLGTGVSSLPPEGALRVRQGKAGFETPAGKERAHAG